MTPREIASLLGRLSRGRRKRYTKAERKRRALQLEIARLKRWK